MSDSRSKWEEMCEEEGRKGVYPQYFGRADRKSIKNPSIEQRIEELEKRIDKQTELLEEILKTLE